MTDLSQNINYQHHGRKRHPRKKRKWVIWLSIVLFIILIRLLLPVVVLKYVNHALAKSKTHPGSVEDIDLALIRGAYQIDRIRIETRDTITGEIDSLPFFTAERVDLALEWGALFKGKIAGKIAVETPRVNFRKEKDPVRVSEAEEAKKDTADFRQTIRDLMPLTVNRFEIHNGRIHYIDPFVKPPLDVSMTDITVVAENFSNTEKNETLLPASLRASAAVYGGHVDLDLVLDPLNKQPTFDLTTKVTDVEMVRLNHFFNAYGNFDVHAGKFGLFTEFAAREGKFKGYVKPLIRDLDVVELKKDDENLGKLLWEGVVGTVAEVFENQPEEQVATKLPLEGAFTNPEASVWEAVNFLLRNAFVQALKPQIDQTINIGVVEEVPEVEDNKTFLQKIFGKDKNKDGGRKGKDQN